VARSRALSIGRWRHLLVCAAMVGIAPFGASPPFSCPGASLFASWSARLGHEDVSRERTRMRHCERSEAIQMACAGIWIASSLPLLAMTRLYPPPQSGGGGPPEGRWRGHAALRPAVRPSPLPPRSVRGPLPAARGGMRTGALRQPPNLPGRHRKTINGHHANHGEYACLRKPPYRP
jgi:hypothetical protein